MSESAISPRALSGAEEFDRRMRSIAQSSAAHSEALEELARLVGHQDPFGEAHPADPEHHGSAADDPITQPPADYLGGGVAYGGLEQAAETGSPAEPAIVHPPVSEPGQWERAVPRYPSISVHDLRPVEPSPDTWAQGAEEESYGPMPVVEVRDEARVQPESSHAKRTLMVLLAVMVLTGGGLAAALLKHPAATGSVVDTAASTPTILAATGPTKVQPETPATTADAPSEPSTLLDKNKNDGTAAAKVVNTAEQPVDLGQAMKPAAIESADPSAPPSPFPEPRKVKTILVRPDGSIIADAVAPAAAAPASAATQQASLAFDPTTAIPIANRPAEATPVVASVPPDAAAPVEKPPAVKTTARVPAAKPVASTSQGSSAAAEGRSAVATPKAKPIAHLAKPKPKPVVAEVSEGPPTLVPDAAPPAPAPAPAAPVAVADATPTATAATGQGGSFAVQLGAAPTEAEGQATAAKLSQKYAGDLVGSKPTVRKAAAAGKTVFRIRVGNLSQDEAKALCGKVQAGGGACFVTRN